MPKNVVQTKYGADLDLTGYELPVHKLKEQLLKDVRATQMFAGFNLPDKMFVTAEQFKLLEQDTTRMEDTKDRMYITPHNVMEVHVVNEPPKH